MNPFAAYREILEQGASQIGLHLEAKQIEQLLAYLTLLQKWNAVYNLTAVRDPREMVTHHVLDSLAVVPAFADARRVLDVGSGGGLPGIVLAICYPEMAVAMVDTVSKKTAFLSQVKAELGLHNVTVYHARVEKLMVAEKFDTITSRAFSELANFVNWSQHLLVDGGRYLALKGQAPTEEIAHLPMGWQMTQCSPIQVPMLNEQRHLLTIIQQS